MQDIFEESTREIEEWIKKNDVNMTDFNGLNALHYAIIFKKENMVALLLQNGAGEWPTLRKDDF